MSNRKFDVFCVSCKKAYHETTDSFKRDEKPNGTMFHLKEEHRAKRIYSFPEKVYIKAGRLECPGCGILYVNGKGELVATLVEQDDPMNERYLLVRKLRRDNISYAKIAEQIGVSASMAYKIDKEHIGRKKPC